MADEQNPEALDVAFSPHFVISLCEQMDRLTLRLIEELQLPPYMHALCLRLSAEVAEHNLQKISTPEGFARYEGTRDEFLATLRQAVSNVATREAGGVPPAEVPRG